jgi:hypothetical protein
LSQALLDSIQELPLLGKPKAVVALLSEIYHLLTAKL